MAKNKVAPNENMPQIALSGKERVIKQYNCVGERQGRAEYRSTEVIITSKRFIKKQEYVHDNQRSVIVDQILLTNIKSISQGKYVGNQKNRTLLVCGIILIPVLIGFYLLWLYTRKHSEINRWLTLYIEVGEPIFKFGERGVFQGANNNLSGNSIIVDLYDGLDHLGEELMAIIFDINEMGVNATVKKWCEGGLSESTDA